MKPQLDPWGLRCAVTFDERDTFDVVREGRARLEAWRGPREVGGGGHYANTPVGHIRGVAGELAAKAWLRCCGLSAFRDDARGSTWDWLTDRYAIEVKARHVRSWDRYAWHVNTGTVDSALKRATRRPVMLLAWAIVYGPDDGPTGAEVAGFATLDAVAASPVHDTGRPGHRQLNHIVDLDDVHYPHTITRESTA